VAPSISRLASEAIENYGSKKAFNNLKRQDGILAVFGIRGAIQFETGGREEFRERTMYGPNTNIDFRGKNVSVPNTDDDGFTIISVPQRVIDGTVIWNQIENDQIQGQWKLAESLIKDKVRQFSTTYVNKVMGAIRAAVPTADGPYTILPSGTSGTVNGILVPASQAAQSGITTAGIDRGETFTDGDGTTVRWWANQYSNTSMDLTTVAGQQSLFTLGYGPCGRSAAAGGYPDFGVTSLGGFGALSAFSTNLKRGSLQNDEIAKLGFSNIEFYKASIIFDTSSRWLNGTKHKMAFINTDSIVMKVLKGSGPQMEEVDEENGLKSLPVYWKHKDLSDPYTLNWVNLGYTTLNLVPRSLQDHGLVDNIS